MKIQTVLETLKEKYISKEIFIYKNTTINNYTFYSFLENKNKSIESIKCSGLVKDVEIDSDIEDYDYTLVIKCNDDSVYLKLPRD